MEEAGGAGAGGAVVNIDLTGVENKLDTMAATFDTMVATMSMNEKRLTREIAAQIFANTSFDTGTSPYQIASNSISRAMVLVDALKSKNLF